VLILDARVHVYGIGLGGVDGVRHVGRTEPSREDHRHAQRSERSYNLPADRPVVGSAGTAKAIGCPGVQVHSVTTIRDAQCVTESLVSSNVHCSRDSPSPTRSIEHFPEGFPVHETMNLNGVDTQQPGEPRDLLGQLQVGHQHGRDIRWSSCYQHRRVLRRESILAPMGDSTDEADGIGAGSNRDFHIGFRADTANLDSWTHAHCVLGYPMLREPSRDSRMLSVSSRPARSPVVVVPTVVSVMIMVSPAHRTVLSCSRADLPKVLTPH